MTHILLVSDAGVSESWNIGLKRNQDKIDNSITNPRIPIG